MEHRVVWVHGIGDHRPGYSAPWEQSFNTHLALPHDSYVEVVWEIVFDAARRAMRAERRGDRAPIRLSRREQLAEAEVREHPRPGDGPAGDESSTPPRSPSSAHPSRCRRTCRPSAAAETFGGG